MKVFAIFAAVALIATNADAVPITFSQTGVGSGTIGTTSFTNSSFTFRSIGDTNNRRPDGVGIFVINLDSSVLEINGLGTFHVTDRVKTFVNNNHNAVGLSRIDRPPNSGYDIFNGPYDPAFANWDMLSSIGPVSANNAIILQFYLGGLRTDGGVLIMTSASNVPATYFATVPEPSTLALAALGLLIAARRKR